MVKHLTRTGGVSALAFTPDGQGLISAGYDSNQSAVNGFINSTGEIRLWRLSDGVVATRSVLDDQPKLCNV